MTNNKIAIYPGTFDPITNGHIDVLQRALKIFDKIIILVAKNPKKKELFSLKKRIELIKESTKGMNIKIETTDGLIVDFVKSSETNIVLRGIRAMSDFDYEFQMATVNKDMHHDFETLFIVTDKKYFYLSSSLVKELAGKKANISKLVPEPVEKALKTILSELI